MKLIKFSYHLFCKNILMSIIIIIQLVASTLLLSDILVTANSYFVTVDEYISSGLSNINGIIVDNGGNPVPDRLLNKLPENSIDYCELGGVSMVGANGDLIGTMFGVFIFTLISNLLNLNGISTNYQFLIKGFILIVALAISSIRNREE